MKRNCQKRYLFINKIGPEPGLSSLVRIRGKQWRLIVPDLVYVLTMMRDSHTGFPLWMRTGICLLMGFISKSRGLLLLKSSSLDPYLIPFSARAILTLIPYRLGQKSNRTTSPAIVTEL